MQARLLWVVVWCTMALAQETRAARLLAVLPTNTRSHYVMYGRLIDALAKKNHQLTIISHFPMVRTNLFEMFIFMDK